MSAAEQRGRIVGRYAVFDEIASGGMATVHLGRLLGPVGFSRTVAIKRLYPHFAKDPDFVAMFLDEARLAARVQHPNVVSTLDVVSIDPELLLVMEFVQGDTLSRLIKAARASNEFVPAPIACAIVAGALNGLHAAHEAKDEQGVPLGIVHRDVSPQNVMVGADGNARVLDFGVAKAAGRSSVTREGQLKGKIAYMPPEQISGGEVDRRSDVYGAGVVLWETLTSRRLFEGDGDAVIIYKVTNGQRHYPPSAFVPGLSPALDAVVMRALSPDPVRRFPTAQAMAEAIEGACPPATTRQVGAWVERVSGAHLAKRIARVKEIESKAASLTALMAAGASLPTGFEDVTRVEAPTGPSQVSSLSSLSRSGPGDLPQPRRSPALAVAGVLGLVVVGLVAFIIHDGGPESPPNPPQSVAGPLGPLGPGGPGGPGDGGDDAGAGFDGGSGFDGGPESPPNPPSAASATAPTVTTRAAPKAVAAPRNDCVPPYTIDAKGIRHPKLDCL